MHPYIAQIDAVDKGACRGIFRRWWKMHCRTLGVAMIGTVAGWAVIYEGFAVVGLFVLALSMVAFVVPAVRFLVELPLHLVLLLDTTDHNEMAQNTFYHKAVVWCEHDPSLIDVFAHFKCVFDRADAQTRRDLIWLILGWETPKGLGDVCLSHEEAKRRFDEMLPSTVSVEMEPSAWRTFSKKYLRI